MALSTSKAATASVTAPVLEPFGVQILRYGRKGLGL